MRYYATEITAISPKTKKLTVYQGAIIAANSYKEAVKYCNVNGLPYCKVVGEIDRDEEVIAPVIDKEGTEELIDAYGEVLDPKVITANMSYDDFIDWLDLGTEKDVLSALKVFTEAGLHSHSKVIKIYLKDKYGDKEKG